LRPIRTYAAPRPPARNANSGKKVNRSEVQFALMASTSGRLVAERLTLLSKLSEDVKSYVAMRELKVLESPTALEFMREAVSMHQPVIIRGLLDDWLPFTNLTEFLNEAPSTLAVNVTPDGHGDCIADGIFCLPCEMQMEKDKFIHMLEARKHDDAVPYLSSQNDNLRTDMASLLAARQIPRILPLARDCWPDAEVEALNLWIGDERAVSSIHKDFFENLYCVLEGEKIFTLLPPSDVAFLPTRRVPMRRYAVDSSVSFPPKRSDVVLIDEQGGEVLSWIDLDPEDPLAREQYPPFALASPLRVHVQKGEVLYLPALWYHRVTQSRLTIAVNYWIEMRFDYRFIFYETVKRLTIEDEEEIPVVQGDV